MNDKENISIMSDLTSELGDLKITASSPNKGTPQRKPLSTVFNNGAEPTGVVRPSDILVQSSPKRGTSTRVIESLHSEIDSLKLEIAKLKSNNDELKKSNEVVKKRRDQLVEQLSNTKHENETINSLLQRKQRRINDLEEQLSDVSNSSDDFKFKLQNLKTRYDKLQENEASSTAEYERLKIAYDTIVSSQKEYRTFYTTEIKSLKEKLDKFTQEKHAEINKNISLINKSDATIYRSIKSITLRSREIENNFTKREEVQLKSIADLSHRLDQHSYDVEGLLKLSKEIFHEIAVKCEIDKETLLKQYLEENPNREDPFESGVEEIEQSTETTEAASESTTPAITAVEDINEEQNTNETIPPIVLKKRDDKSSLSLTKNAKQRTLSVEQRITSLGKELNSMIPLKDRSTNLEGVNRTRSTKRHSKQLSQSRVTSGTTDSRRSSKIFDGEDLALRIGTAAGYHSRTSSISTDVHQGEIDVNIVPVTKRKRQRRRKNKKNGGIGAIVDQSFEHSGNESN